MEEDEIKDLEYTISCLKEDLYELEKRLRELKGEPF